MKVISLTNGHVYVIGEEEALSLERVTTRFVTLRNGVRIQISMIVDIADKEIYIAQEKLVLKNKGLRRCPHCFTIHPLSKLCECRTGSSVLRLKELNEKNGDIPIPEVLDTTLKLPTYTPRIKTIDS